MQIVGCCLNSFFYAELTGGHDLAPLLGSLLGSPRKMENSGHTSAAGPRVWRLVIRVSGYGFWFSEKSLSFVRSEYDKYPCRSQETQTHDGAQAVLLVHKAHIMLMAREERYVRAVAGLHGGTSQVTTSYIGSFCRPRLEAWKPPMVFMQA